MPSVPCHEGVSVNVDPYAMSNVSPATRKSGRSTTPSKKAGGTTQAEIDEEIVGVEGAENVEATPPRRAIEDGLQPTAGIMMPPSFVMLSKMEASAQEVEEDKGQLTKDNR